MRIISGIGRFFASLLRRAVRLALFSALAGAALLVLDLALLRDKGREDDRP